MTAPSGPVVALSGVDHFLGAGKLRKQILFDVSAEIRSGEIVIVIAPPPDEAADADDLDTLLRQALARLSVKEAVAEIAAVTGRPRREVYQRALALAKAEEPR